MKAKQKIRALRALAIAGSMSALVIPSSSFAMLPKDSFENAAHQRPAQPYQLPAQFRTESQTPSSSAPAQTYQLRRSFHAEVTTPVSSPPQTTFRVPASFHPEVQTPSSPVVASNPGSVVHEIRTVTDDGSPTLAIVLAAVALAIALMGSAYAWVRLTRVERDISSRALVG